MTTVYESRPVKRCRRTRRESDSLDETILAVLEEIQPATVRQTYYQLVSRGAIAKTEQEYKGVVRRLTILRRARRLPFDWLADNTRWMRKPQSYGGTKELLEDTAQLYRRAIWREQPCYVEVWLEKDALSGVLLDVTAEYDVPLMVTRGYPSLTFLHSAAEAIASVGKPTFLYYFGDFDPSGIDIPRKVEAGIREFAPDADVSFELVAVTEEQIETLKLPTRPTKKGKHDHRARTFGDESVEVDAIDPDTLRQMVANCITRHIDQEILEVTKAAEESERGWLEQLANMVSE